MKLLVVIVALNAAFLVHCRHFSDGSSNQVSTNDEEDIFKHHKEEEEVAVIEAQSFADEPVNSDFTDEDQYISFGPEKPDLIEEDKNRYNNEPEPPVVEDGNEHDEIVLRGKGDKRNLQKLIKNFEAMKYNLTWANTKIEMEIQSLREHQNKISNMNTKLMMKILNKMDNITDGSKQLKMELQSIKYYQNNITNADKEHTMELDSILTKLKTIEAVQVTGRLAHFPYATHKKSWADAKAFCESIGGQIWTPLDKAQTVAAFKACGTLCWNGWHKNSGGTWVTGTGQVKSSNFWAASEPGSSDTAAWSSETGIWGRLKTSLYGWSCQM